MEAGERMSKTILTFLDKHATALHVFRSRTQMRFNNSFIVESEFEAELQSLGEKLIGKKIYELKRVSTNLTAEKNEISLKILTSKARNELVDQLLIVEEELLDIKIALLEKAIEIKQEYQKQPTYEVERNILDHPMFSSTTPNEKTLEMLRTKDGIIEQHRKGFRRLFYRNENGFLLTTYDMKVFIGLFKLWGEMGKNAKFKFSYQELAEILFIEKTGGDFRNIEKSLSNLASTSIIMEEYFNPKTGKRTKTIIHNPIQTAVIDGELLQAEIEFSNYLHDNLTAGNVVVISMALFNDLASPTSKNLYLTITNSMKDEQYSLDLDTLIEHVGVHGSTRYKCVQTIKEGFQELKDFGFLSDFDLINRGNMPVKVVFSPSTWAREVAGHNLSLAAFEVSGAREWTKANLEAAAGTEV